MPGEADLLVLGQFLIAEHDHQVLMPGVENGRDRLRRRLLAQVDADDFGTQGRRQRLYANQAGVFLEVFRDSRLVHCCSILWTRHSVTSRQDYCYSGFWKWLVEQP